MSDLISRSELIKELNKYCGNQRYLVSENIREIINNQPIAYSVGKVVSELEEMIHPKQLYFCKYARGGCKHLYNDDKDCMECVVENAIEIVKQGGVSDDVCEWKRDDMCDTVYKVCGGCFTSEYQKDFKYCPYCGKKIKVVE